MGCQEAGGAYTRAQEVLIGRIWQLLIILLMKNEGHWNESFDEFRSEEAEHAPGPSSSRSSLQKNGVEEGRDREQQVISQFE